MTNEQEIRKAAALVMLSLSEEEQRELEAEWTGIMQMIGRIQEADITAVEPLFHPLQAYAPCRPDEVTETNRRDLLQKDAPEVTDGHYLVPRFVE